MTGAGTMQCEEARLQIGADPAGSTAGLEAHVAGCADCAGYRREMRALDGDLRLAMAWPRGAAAGLVAPPDGNVVPLRATAGGLPAGATAAAPAGVSVGAARRDARADAHAPPPTARRWALAASVLVAAMLGTWFVALQPRDALAAAVVAHLSEEPDSWSKTQPIPRSALELVLARSGVRLDQVESGNVVYANSCFLRGRYMPHLVVSTPTGPVTVIVLRGESVPERVEFAEGRYSGVLLPVPGGGGGIAVLARRGAGAAGSAKTDFEAAAVGVLAALQFDDAVPPAKP